MTMKFFLNLDFLWLQVFPYPIIRKIIIYQLHEVKYTPSESGRTFTVVSNRKQFKFFKQQQQKLLVYAKGNSKGRMSCSCDLVSDALSSAPFGVLPLSSGWLTLVVRWLLQFQVSQCIACFPEQQQKYSSVTAFYPDWASLGYMPRTKQSRLEGRKTDWLKLKMRSALLKAEKLHEVWVLVQKSVLSPVLLIQTECLRIS